MNGVSKITVYEDVSLVTISNVDSTLEALSFVLQSFAVAGINIDMISQTTPTGGSVSVSFSVSGKDLVKVLEITNKFRDERPALKPLVSSGNTKVQLFGEEMREMYGVASRAVDAVARSGAQALMITTSEVDISFLLSNYNVDKAIEELENEFFVTASHE